MKKNEMVKEIQGLIAFVEDREKFSEKLDLKDGEYYPAAYSWVVSSLQFLLECEERNINILFYNK